MLHAVHKVYYGGKWQENAVLLQPRNGKVSSMMQNTVQIMQIGTSSKKKKEKANIFARTINMIEILAPITAERQSRSTELSEGQANLV